MITHAEDRLDFTSVPNLFRTGVKSKGIFGISDYIMVIHDNQFPILFIIWILSLYLLLFST